MFTEAPIILATLPAQSASPEDKALFKALPFPTPAYILDPATPLAVVPVATAITELEEAPPILLLL